MIALFGKISKILFIIFHYLLYLKYAVKVGMFNRMCVI